MQTPHLDRLRSLLASVRLELADDGGLYTVTWEKRRYPLATLPLDGLVDGAIEAELLAVAAGIDAAIKAPGRLVENETLRDGTQHVLAKIERARFADAYNAVIDGAGGDPSKYLLYQPFGANLITTYVEDQGWKFVHLIRGRYEAWKTTPGTIHSVARSNLYHREAVDHTAREVMFGDGYDAARAILIDDVFYDRIGPEGAEIAVPGRDLLMIAAPGATLSAAVVRQAYETAKYPISPDVLLFRDDTVSIRGGLSA